MTAFDGNPVGNVGCEYGNINAGNITQNGNQVAQLSQVVRTDTAQSLNSTQQLQAQNNIYPTVTDLNNVPLPFGICSQVFTFSVNTANAPTTDGGTLIQSIFNTASGGIFTQTAIMNTESGGEIYTRRHNGARGFTNWQRYISIDPTTLTPSTDNGWTKTSLTDSFPSAGKYLVKLTNVEGNSSIKSYIFEVVYDGSSGGNTFILNTRVTGKFTAGVSHFYVDTVAQIESATVWFKRI